jgi:glycosyltransferase involved in cell wall biosynthesis
MQNNPPIAVLMSVYNAEKYLRESIDSILNQTFIDFTFLIINDCSTDASHKILLSYKDSRIVVIDNQKNIGLTKSLNKGLKIAKSKYITRMDADDISLPKRLEKQFKFMEENPEIGICGTWVKTFGQYSRIWSPPVKHNAIKTGMFFENMIYHPTVIIRKSILDNLPVVYNESYKQSQDAELWDRLIHEDIKFANIGEMLLKYRIHSNQIGQYLVKDQNNNFDKVRFRQFNRLNLTASKDEIGIYNCLKNKKTVDIDDIKKSISWLCKIENQNIIYKIYPESELKIEFARRLFSLCLNSTKAGFSVLSLFYNSIYGNIIKLTLIEQIKFFIKALFRINNKNDIFLIKLLIKKSNYNF